MSYRRLTPRGTVLAAGLASLALLAAGCGGGGPSGVASVTSPTTTAAKAARSAASREEASSVGGSSAAPRGGGSHTVMQVGNTTQGARFSACMRAHGLSSFPDPNSQGTIAFGAGIDPHSTAFRTAMSACRKLLPAGFGQAPSAAQLAQAQQGLVAFAVCMRAHGIGNFPDPSGAALPPLQPVGDLDPNNPRYRVAYGACKTHLPAGLPPKALGGLAPPTGSSG